MIFTDEQLREALAEGLTKAEIARRYGVSKPAVSKRVNRLGLTTAAAAHAPEESRRYARANIDVMEQLAKSLGKVNLLMDACDEWLRDPERPEVYDLGPRAGEVDIHYLVEARAANGTLRTEKRKKRLAELLGMLEGQDEDGARFSRVEKGEYKHADPRELILKTAAEARQTVNSLTEIARLLNDARAMEVLREAILLEIGKVDAGVASRIAEAVRRSIVCHTALGGPGALGTGGDAN